MCVRMNVKRVFLCAFVSVFVLAGTADAEIIVPTIVSESNTNPYSTSTTDKLIDNSGMTPAVNAGDSLDAALAATHMNTGVPQSWVTNAAAPDYFAASAAPVIVWDLTGGGNAGVASIILWQYQNDGGGDNRVGNHARTIELRFNTEAEGSGVFSEPATTITMKPTLTGEQNTAQGFDLAGQTCRYIQMTFTDNHYGDPDGLGVHATIGGDRVGLGEVRFAAVPDVANTPDPANAATDVCPNVILGWNPGADAERHDVYFGTDFDSVNNASTSEPLGVLVSVGQTQTYYPVSGTLDLAYGTIYYWRVDEVKGIPASTAKGAVWQFSTEPLGYQLPNDRIIATADSNEPDQGPEKTLDLVGDLHSTVASEMWLSATGASEPNWIEYEFDKVYRLHEMWVWNHNTALENSIGLGVKNATVQYSTDGENYTTLGVTHEFDRAPGETDYAHITVVSFAGVAAQYVRITANSNWGGLLSQYGLSEVRFFYVPVRARTPYPESEATDVPVDTVLSWTPGREAAMHDVYLSTDARAVMEGTVDPCSISAEDSCESRYDPQLELGRTYYWKVNEVNMGEEPDTWEGEELWSFSTPAYSVVDDMTSYGDADEVGQPGSRIWYTWKDGEGWPTPLPGYAGNGTGSAIEPNSVPFYDTVQSMAYHYSSNGTNLFGHSKERYSEATALISDLGIGSDWTVDGIRSLTLHFYGDAGNAAGPTEQMYVKLNGAKVVYDGDMADITEASWHEWNIDLAAFGINLQNVTEISIGFGIEGNAVLGGSGVVIFDDIRLYPARCIPSLLKPSADLNDDCRVDHSEVDIISDNWLIGAYEVTPAAPGDASLAGHWTFDNALDLGADSTGNNNGTVGDGASASADAKVGSGALALDGDGDCIRVGGGPFFSALDDNGDGFTVAAWVKLVHTSEFSLMRIFSTDMSISGAGWGFGFIQPPARLRFTTYGVRDYDAGGWMAGYLPDNNQWIHVAAVYKSDGDVDFYVGGIWIETVAGDFSLNDTDGYLIGGLAAATSGEWFGGLIDDLRIYDTELSHGQVGSLANQTLPYIQDISPLLTPRNPNIDWNGDGTINFGDFAGLMQQWLDELLWP